MENEHILPRFFVVAGVLIWRDDRILLVKKDCGDKNWTLPSRMMEKGEAINQTTLREVKEEIGVDVRLTRILWIYSASGTKCWVVSARSQISCQSHN